MQHLKANVKAFVADTFPKLYNKLEAKHKKSELQTMNKSYYANAVDSLRKFVEALNQAETTYWLSFGTLIGAIREHGFLKHDMDIDVGVLDTTDFDRMDRCLKDNGFFLSRRIDIYSRNGMQGFELTYSDGKMPIDIFVFSHLEGNNYYTHGFTGSQPMIGGKRWYSNVYRYTLPFEGVTEIDFCGIKTTIPINYDVYLRCYYGDYMTPDPNWTWHVTPAITLLDKSVGITAFPKGERH